MANVGWGIDGMMTGDTTESVHAPLLPEDAPKFRPQNFESMSACAEFPRRAPPSFGYVLKDGQNKLVQRKVLTLGRPLR